MNVASFFAGVGGSELGFKKTGFDIIWANELDEYAGKTFRANFGSKLVIDDIKILVHWLIYQILYNLNTPYQRH